MFNSSGSIRVIPYRDRGGMDYRSHQESRWYDDEPTALEQAFDSYLTTPIGSPQAELELLELRLLWEQKGMTDEA